ncbi:MAG: hypothetical protein RBQ71_00155 [Acholeplasmataceae bacterium]|jgi:hypothetical protein|nr:hypothetical protein [Acholeplasmataceae bacterium]
MKKGLSLLLLSVLMLFTTIGIQLKAADATESFVFHVHQMDTDYSKTGIGVWDGTTWNDYADVVTANDTFGGVITKTYSAEAYALVNNKTSVEFKPSRDVSITNAEPKNVLLAPGDGKVFADISALNADGVDEIDLFYVEGSKKIFMGTEGFAPLIVVYGDPNVVIDDAVYDSVTPAATGYGTGGSVSNLFDFVYEGELFDINSKIFMINVAPDAADNTVITIGGKDYTVSNTSLKAGTGQVVFIEKGADTQQSSGTTWGETYELNYQLRAGNKFQSTTIITNPTTISAEFLMAKNPARLSPSRFIILDKDNQMIPVDSITHSHSDKIGTFTAVVTPTADQNYFVLHISTNLDHSKIGLVGAIQGWNPDAAITSSGVDSHGNAVFEAATTELSGGYKVLYDEAGDGFSWSDYQITASDQPFDFDGDNRLVHYINAQIIIVGDFTATKTVTGNEKMLQVHVETDKDHTKLGLVGDVQGWNPGAAILASGEDSKGYVVFEVPTTVASGSYKVLFDETGNGFSWDDPQVTPDNQAFSFGDNTSLKQYINEATKALVNLGAPINTMPLDVKQFSLHVTDENSLSYGTEYTLKYIEVIDPEELIISSTLPFNLSHELVEGDYVDGTGTLALSPTLIQIELNKRMGLLVELVDDANQVITLLTYKMDSILGNYTYKVTADQGENLVRLHLDLNATTVTELSQLGLVGSVQGWSPDNAIHPTGIDSQGNYVFEVSAEGTTGEIKILFASDGVFNWGDPEITPGNVVLVLDGGSYLIQEGSTTTNSSTKHMMTLSTSNKLTKDGTYFLRFRDSNGFIYYQELLIDNQAPTITAPLQPNVEFIIDQNATFNELDFFTTISVVDNVEGEMDYVVTKAINTAILGVQVFEIKATDNWGNQTTMSWSFTVGRGPVITLTQDAIELNEDDTEPNWSSFASVDRGTLTINSSQVDMTTAGTYYVFYYATDATGSNQEVITVTVNAVEIPKTGCFSSISMSNAVFMAFCTVGAIGITLLYKGVKKGRKVI